MYLTRNEMIENVKQAFLDYGYKSAVDKRLGFGFSIAHLTTSDCRALNCIVENFDNPMLTKVVFVSSMSESKVDDLICRLLYVSGNWIELCYYQMLIKDAYNLYYFNVCNKTETHITVFFTTKDSNIGMSVDDQKVGIKLVTTIKEEKEF